MGGFVMRLGMVMHGGRRLGPLSLAALVLGAVLVAGGGPATAAGGPTVTGVSPDAGLTGGATSVTVSGTGFTGTTAVDFGTVAGTAVHVVSDSSLTVSSPAESAGTVDITVAAPGGTSATGPADQFTYVAPGAAPTISVISPRSGLETGGTPVTLTGTGFTGTTAVTFGAIAATSFDVVSDTTLTAVTPVEFSTGAMGVDVVTPNGTGRTSFTFVTPGPAPTVTGVKPFSGLDSGTTVTITGTGLTGADTVTFGGTEAATFIVSSDTSILAQSPVQPAGTYDVVVTTPNGTSATGPADQFIAVDPGPPPTITSVTPNAGTTAGGVTFTIAGTGFTGTSVVDLGTQSIPYTVNSDTAITATSQQQAAGTYDVTVTTPNGTSATSLADEFTVVAPQPVVTSVSPSSGTTDGATAVTINGTGFTFATAVAFGTSAATSFTVESDTAITATAPGEAAGSVDVTVTTAGGTSATGPADQYTYVLPPLQVTAISPTSGPTFGGTLVTITGSGFVGATAVDFGTTSAPFTFVSDTEIEAVSPAVAAGRVDVTVTTAAGTTPVNHLVDRFTFVPPPKLLKVKPNKGPTTGGTVVNVHGRRLTGATAVDFGGVPATSFTVNSDSSITATTPVTGNAGTADVVVVTPGGTTPPTSTAAFTYEGIPPAITKLDVNSGSTAGGTAVTITGTNFASAFAVHFGTAEAANIVVNPNGTSIVATSPPGKVGKVHITVTTLNGTSKKSSGDVFTYVERITTPVVTGLNPHAGFTEGPKQSGKTPLIITGTGFTGATTVEFVPQNSQISPEPGTEVGVISDTELSVTSPQYPAADAGITDVIVTTPQGSSTANPSDLFTFVTPGPVATVTGVSPDSGPNTGGTSVVITGTGLSGTTTVDFGSTPVPFTYSVFGNDLLVTSPPAPIGVVDVTVLTPNGTSATGPSDTFTFTKPQIPPTVTGVHPHSGPATGGSRVAIKGTGFIGATTVRFGTVPANFVVKGNGTIVATSPPHGAGTVDVTVTTPNGTTATGGLDQFTFR